VNQKAYEGQDRILTKQPLVWTVRYSEVSRGAQGSSLDRLTANWDGSPSELMNVSSVSSHVPRSAKYLCK
jgi:hypothetical protein